jgi:hypothetical protein
MGYRAEGGVFNFPLPAGSGKVPLKTSKKAAFSYEAFAEMGYGLTEHLQATIGYPLLGGRQTR